MAMSRDLRGRGASHLATNMPQAKYRARARNRKAIQTVISGSRTTGSCSPELMKSFIAGRRK